MRNRLKRWCARLFRSDLSHAYQDSSIPEQQRQIVDRELEAMYAGNPPGVFQAAADMLNSLPAEKPLRFLDMGCASGYYSEVIRHMVRVPLRYEGADFSAAMLDMARAKYPDVHFQQEDVRALSYPDRAFDVVMCSAVVEHVKEYVQALRELGRITHEWLILHRFLLTQESRTVIRPEVHYGVTVYRVYVERAEFLDILQKTGFEMVRETSIA